MAFLLNFPLLALHCSSHLPLMFVGMEHIMLSNHEMADEALNAANQMCDGDPLLINELGVMAFTHGKCVHQSMVSNPSRIPNELLPHA